MNIVYSPKFLREYKRLPVEIKLLIESKGAIFRCNPFDFRLKTHRLHGRLTDLWAFSVNYHYRIIFEFVDGNTVELHTVGNHDIYE